MVATLLLEPVSEPVEAEAALVARARGGDAAAFEQIVRLHADAVYRIAAAMVGPDEAEDVAQEVFVKIHKALPRFRGESRLRTWIYRVTSNAALKRMARTKRRTARIVRLGEQDPAADAPAPGANLEADERREALMRALDQLPEHQRAVVVLRGLEGLSYEEVARVLGIRRPTAESRMARAKVTLRDLLGRWLKESK